MRISLAARDSTRCPYFGLCLVAFLLSGPACSKPVVSDALLEISSVRATDNRLIVEVENRALSVAPRTLEHHTLGLMGMCCTGSACKPCQHTLIGSGKGGPHTLYYDADSLRGLSTFSGRVEALLELKNGHLFAERRHNTSINLAKLDPPTRADDNVGDPLAPVSGLLLLFTMGAMVILLTRGSATARSLVLSTLITGTAVALITAQFGPTWFIDVVLLSSVGLALFLLSK